MNDEMMKHLRSFYKGRRRPDAQRANKAALLRHLREDHGRNSSGKVSFDALLAGHVAAHTDQAADR